MRLIRKTSSYVSEDICKEILSTYLNFVKNNIPSIDQYTLTELLRYSICKGLNLTSIGFNNFVNIYSDNCIQALTPIFEKYNLKNMSEDYKKGLLEACVHYIEFSRKKANIHG